jgi:hypothetical protein
MRELAWDPGKNKVDQLRALCFATRNPGVLVIRFEGGKGGVGFDWNELEPVTRSRAVTTADVAADLGSPELGVALCCDLVYLREGVSLLLPEIDQPTSPGLVWALSRAGRAATAAGLLVGGRVEGTEAVRLGLAQEIVSADDPLPLPRRVSLSALTAARDLMRSRAGGAAGRALELATFRLLFASGDPIEGAMAFLERRDPEF